MDVHPDDTIPEPAPGLQHSRTGIMARVSMASNFEHTPNTVFYFKKICFNASCHYSEHAKQKSSLYFADKMNNLIPRAGNLITGGFKS